METTIKDLVKGNKAQFVCYRDGELWYRIVPTTASKLHASADFSFEFPIPVSDTGSGIFPAQLNAITLMRWIRRHFERINSGQWQNDCH